MWRHSDFWEADFFEGKVSKFPLLSWLKWKSFSFSLLVVMPQPLKRGPVCHDCLAVHAGCQDLKINNKSMSIWCICVQHVDMMDDMDDEWWWWWWSWITMNSDESCWQFLFTLTLTLILISYFVFWWKAQATELDFLACLDSLDCVINGKKHHHFPAVSSPETDCSGDPTREKWDDATKECGNQGWRLVVQVAYKIARFCYVLEWFLR